MKTNIVNALLIAIGFIVVGLLMVIQPDQHDSTAITDLPYAGVTPRDLPMIFGMIFVASLLYAKIKRKRWRF